jgi:selenocysteine lyase/cysteine desulfurase
MPAERWKARWIRSLLAGACAGAEFSVPKFRACMDGAPVGALRASLGAATTEADLDRLFELMSGLTNSSCRAAG